MAGPLLKSALKVAAEEMPDTFSTQGAKNMLKKKGVKDEELTFSQVGKRLDTATEMGTKKLRKETLESAIPEGQFGEQVITGDDALYNWVSTPKGEGNPTYKERIITFGEDSRYTSGHFPDESSNYLMHNRVYDDVVDGTPSRVLQEVQSDLHQAGRRDGYVDLSNPPEISQGAIERINKAVADEEMELIDGDELLSIATSYGWKQSDNITVNEWANDLMDNNPNRLAGSLPPRNTPAWDALAKDWDQLQKDYTEIVLNEGEVARYADEGEVSDAVMEFLDKYTPGLDNDTEIVGRSLRSLADQDAALAAEGAGVPKSPWEKTWQKKGIELEIAAAVDDGLEQLVIPISGPQTSRLQRADSVKTWYDTTVTNTAKKVAKQYGAEFEVVGGGQAAPVTTEEAVQGLKTHLDDATASLRAQGMSATVDEQGPNIRSHYSRLLQDFLGVRDRDLTDQLAESYMMGNDSGLSLYFDLNTAPAKEFDKSVVIKFPKDELGNVKKPDFKLYAAPPAAIFAGLAAKEQGYGDDEIAAYAEQQGISPEELALGMTQASKAREAGYTDDEITEFLQSAPTEVKGVDSEFLDPAYDLETLNLDEPTNNAFAKIMGTEEITLSDLVTSMKVVHPNMMSVTMRTAAFFGNEAAARQAADASRSQAQKIVNATKSEFGIDLEWNEDSGMFYLNGENGKVEISEGFLDMLESEGLEIAGAVAGGLTGGYLGKNLGGWGAFGGSIVGAMAGSAIGTQGDYLIEAIRMQQDMHANVAATKAMTAAEASVVGDIIGYGVFKGLGTGWKFLDSVYQGIKDGNSKGAVQAAKDVLFVGDAEAEELVTRLDKLLTEPVPGNKNQREIKAIAMTHIGSEAIVKAAGQIDPMAGQAAIRSIDARAQDALATTAEIADADTVRIIREDLANYTADVKRFYNDVKTQAARSPKANDFAFDFEALAINPALQKMAPTITEPTLRDKFVNQMQYINSMSTSRTMADLIELRQLVNEFRFDKRIGRPSDKEMLHKIVGNIDDGIRLAAKTTMENPDEWLANFATARAEYAKMKKVEKNVMYKALTRPGVSEATAVRSLSKYIVALDGTFSEVMSKLPAKAKNKTEGAVLEFLTDKYTAGMEDGLRATHFPLLQQDLNKVAFTTPEARRYKAAVERMAEVFRNDVPLAQVTGQIQIPKFQSYLTADPVVRMKFEIASGVFNTIKTFVPGKEQRNMALVNNVTKLLEQPLNSRAARDVMNEMAGDVDLSAQIVALQQEAAKKAMDDRAANQTMIKLYGEGAVKSFKGTDQTGSIPMHRIADHASVGRVADEDGIARSDVENLDYALKQRGYAGVLTGTDKVRVL